MFSVLLQEKRRESGFLDALTATVGYLFVIQPIAAANYIFGSSSPE